MPFNPGVTPRGGDYVMGGLALGQRASEMWGQLAQALIQRQQQAQEARSTLETLAGYDQGAGGAGADQTPGSQEDQGDQEETNPLVQQGEQAQAIRNLVKSYAPDNADLHTALKGMGKEQLEGILKGVTLHAAQQEHLARMQDYAAQAQLRRQNALDDVSVGTAMNRYANTPDVPLATTEEGGAQEGQTRPPSAEERFRYAMATPGLSGRSVPKLIASLAHYADVTGPDQSATVEAPVTGTMAGGMNWYGFPHTKVRGTYPNVEGYNAPVGTFITPRGDVKPLPKEEGPSKLPDAANNMLLGAAQDIAGGENDLASTDAELKQKYPALKPEEAKARATRNVATAKRLAKTVIDQHRTLGYFGDEEQGTLYQQYGLGQPKTAARPATAAAAPAAKSAASAAGKVSDAQAMIQQANDAIARGADPGKVKARLKEKYGIEVK